MSASRRTQHLGRVAGSVLLAAALLIGLLPASVASAATGDVGVRDFSYSGVSAPTGQKPESKLWYTADGWFGVLWNSGAKQWRIYRFNWSADNWTDLGVVVDTRAKGEVDALWDAANSKLYVATHIKEGAKTTDMAAKLRRFSYANGTYQADAGFPVTMTTGAIEALVIDQDTTGRVWATWTQTAGSFRKLNVTHATSASNTSFVTPFTPALNGASNLSTDDISTLVEYDGQIGVMWSNQNDNKVYFASHVDGTPDSDWVLNPALSGPKWADDHLNIKSLSSDPAGRVFAVVKTSLNDVYPLTSSEPLILLLTLDGNGTWKKDTVWRINEGDNTRPIVLVSPDTRTLHVFAAGPCCSGGTVVYKTSPLDNPAFPSGLGDTFLKLASDTTINNPSSTKQPVTAASGILVVAGDDHTSFYVHNKITLGSSGGGGNDTTAPTVAITSPAAGASVAGPTPITASAADNVGVTRVDFSVGGVPLASDTSAPWDASADFSGAPEGPVDIEAQAFDAAGNPSTPATITVTVDHTAPDTTITGGPSDPSPVASASFSFTGDADTASFECRLDVGSFTACTSPQVYNGLGNGSHAFAVRAIDAAGNADATPASASWTVDVQGPTSLFDDGFESGSFSAWTTITTATGGVASVQGSIVRTGAYAARLSETSTSGSRAFIRKTLATAVTDTTVSLNVLIESEGASGGNVPILRLYDPAGTRLFTLYRQNLATDSVYASWTSGGSTIRAGSGKIPLGTWQAVSVHVITNGSSSTVEVAIDGTLVLQTSAAVLGTTGIKSIQLGNDTAAQAFSLVADDVLVK